MNPYFVFFRKNSFRIFLLWILILGFLYSNLSIIRHMRFETGAYDLGIFDQAVWKFKEGLGPYNTIKERIIFGDHFSLVLPALGILYLIWSDVRMLLIFQAVFIAASAIPIYRLASKRLDSASAAFGIGFIYSLFYGIQYAVYAEFHTVIIGVALLAWLAYFWDMQRRRLFLLTLLLSLGVQENMGLSVACLSIIFFFRGKPYRIQSVLVGITGVAASILMIVAASAFSPGGYEYAPVLPASIREYALGLFNSEEKMLVWKYTYVPYLFLPIVSPGSTLAIIADLSQYFVTGDHLARTWSPFMHHRAVLAVFVVLGLIDVLVRYQMTRKPLLPIVVMLMISVLVSQYLYHMPLNKLTKKEFHTRYGWMDDTVSMIAGIPEDMRLAAQQNLVPHLSQRESIYLAWPRQHEGPRIGCSDALCWWLDFPTDATYLLVDVRPYQMVTQTLADSDDWLSAIRNMEQAGAIVLDRNIGSVRLYRVLDGSSL